MSVFGSHGNGLLGHAVLVLGLADCNNRSPGDPWVDPVNPGPLNVPPGATAAQIGLHHEQHSQELQEWRTFDACGKKL